MDPMLELAQHPDILDAIRSIEQGRAIRAFDEPSGKQNGEQDQAARRKQDVINAARDLLVMQQLAQDYPNVWMMEVVRAFYNTPEVAAAAWVELRYCRQFVKAVKDLAKQSRRPAHARAIPWSRRKPSRYSIEIEAQLIEIEAQLIEIEAKLRKTRQQDSAGVWLTALSEEDRDLVDRVCSE